MLRVVEHDHGYAPTVRAFPRNGSLRSREDSFQRSCLSADSEICSLSCSVDAVLLVEAVPVNGPHVEMLL